MHKHIILNNGLPMPIVGFGTWMLKGEAGKRAVLDALAVGYRLIDTAHMYDNEAMVGQAVDESGLRREDIFITTKLCQTRAGYELAWQGIEESLARLQTDYIDLLLIHEPYDEALDMYRALTEAFAKRWFRTMFFGAKSSMQMMSFSQISCVDSLCAASCRWLAICSCSLATLIRAFSLRLLPFDFRESCRWRRASFFSDFARYLWFGYETPSEVTAKALMPTSIPTAAPVGGIGLVSASVQQIDTKYLPLGFWLIVADRIRPLTSLLTRHFTRPSLGRRTRLLKIAMLLLVL